MWSENERSSLSPLHDISYGFLFQSFFGPDGLKGSEERTVYVVLASLLPAALVRAHTAVFQHLLAFSLGMV